MKVISLTGTGRLSTGAIVAIALLLLAVAAGVIFWVHRKRYNQQSVNFLIHISLQSGIHHLYLACFKCCLCSLILSAGSVIMGQ